MHRSFVTTSSIGARYGIGPILRKSKYTFMESRKSPNWCILHRRQYVQLLVVSKEPPVMHVGFTHAMWHTSALEQLTASCSFFVSGKWQETNKEARVCWCFGSW